MRISRLLSLTFAVIAILVACEDEAEQTVKTEQAASPPQRVITVDAIVPLTSDVKELATSTGTFIAEDQVQISSEVAGYLTELFFNEGSFKKKGQPLAKINDAELQARKKKLQVDLDYAQQEIRRSEKLLEIQAISTEEGDRLRNTAKVIEAEIAILDAQITKTTILAPFSGRIGIQMKSEGAYLSPGEGIAELHKLNPIKLEFFVPEKLAGIVNQGDEVTFTIPSVKDTFTSKIYLVSPSLEESNRSMRMRCRVNNNSGHFMPGGYADVYYEIQPSKGSLFVPAEAIVPVLNGQKVFKVVDGKIKSQNVEVGMRTSKNVQVVSGLNSRDTILVTGLLSASDGAPVQVNLKEMETI